MMTGAVQASADGWIPFELKGGHVSIPTRVGGQDGYSILDTGASMVAVDEDVAAAAGLKIRRNKFVDVEGITGTQRRVVYQKVPARVFGADLTFKDVTDMSFPKDGMQLLIGGPILQMFVFQFDYTNERMRALPHESVDLRKLSNIESRRDSRGAKLPVIKVGLNGETSLWLTMDTGNNGGLLISRKLAKKQGWLDRYPLEDGAVLGINGAAKTQSFVLPSLQFGPVELENILVTIPAKNQQLPAVGAGRRTSRGLLGFDVLKHFVVTIDYKRGLVHVGLPEEV